MLVSVPHLLLFLFSWTWGILAATPSHEQIVGTSSTKMGLLMAALRTTLITGLYWSHMANALGMYRTVKRLGIPDSNIILMLADDAACNARNKFPGSVYANPGGGLIFTGQYRGRLSGYEVTVENFIRVLTGRMEPSVPRSKRLLTDAHSNVFVYMTGHGGNEFLKFQDNEEISAFDIADAFEQMWQKKRYNEIFFMIDTCQANTMYSKFYSPNILATGSSKLDQNSYSYENDADIGVSVIDRYTTTSSSSWSASTRPPRSVADLFASYDPVKIHSDPGVRADLFSRPLSEVGAGVAAAAAGGAGGDADDAWASAAKKVVPPRVGAETDAGESGPAGAEWRGARAWGGVLLLGALVGWVGWGGSITRR
ncbi:peptidase C13 family-domain-containing protein [Mycena leptocephala]|nr:peptidase C13 family-domain-containing protein [Mycena leptocephala]